MRSHLFFLSLACSFGFTKCGGDEPTDTDPTTDTDTTDTSDTDVPGLDPGALISVSTESMTGVLLDEIPEGDLRAAVTADLLAESPEFWRQRVEQQLDLAYYRLTFRPFFGKLYPDDGSGYTTGYYGYPIKGQLPLPPSDVWNLEISAPYVTTVRGHELVVVDYTFDSVIVSTEDSPIRSEPMLGEVGGVWEETFTFPIDNQLMYQRIGEACANEQDYPPRSVDQSNVGLFYDDSCLEGVGGAADYTGCHFGSIADDCVEAIDNHIGSVVTVFEFERLPWDDTLASSYQVHDAAIPGSGADIVPLVEGGLDINRLTYRYVSEGDCELAEQCVTGTGWRRLMQFDSTSRNLGEAPMHVGDVDELIASGSNLMEYSECHGHYHFNHYANFGVGDDSDGGKRSFCLESTNRFGNNPTTPTDNPYYVCTYQGIESGWGDKYQAGLDCQWVDVTDEALDAPTTAMLFAQANPDGLLCEGIRQYGPSGEALYEPTDFVTLGSGEPIETFVCDESASPGALDNNYGETEITLPPGGEGMTTSACGFGEKGPLRDCGFRFVGTFDCEVGEAVTHEVDTDPDALAQTIRVCDRSEVIGGIACTEAVALRNQIGTSAEFTCPVMRDSATGAGGYTVYTGDIN